MDECRAMREKCWDERSDSEKLDALRSELVAMSYSLARLSEVVSKLEEHTHGQQGQILVHMNSTRPMCSEDRPRRGPMSLRKKNEV